MSEIITVGLDLAKNVFQVHGADGSGRAVLRRKLRRAQVLEFFGQLGPCTVAMEACGGARLLGSRDRQAGPRGAADPAGLCEAVCPAAEERCGGCRSHLRGAAQRPNMRFVPVKSEETQGAASVFRVRELLIRQRTQTINALRGHLTEFGEVVSQGAWNVRRLVALVEMPDSDLPDAARGDAASPGRRTAPPRGAHRHAGRRDRPPAREDETARRLMTIPGIGPLIATALATLAPPPETFGKARDFAAWLGLTPRQHSTGGKQRLGATTKMGSARSGAC